MSAHHLQPPPLTYDLGAGIFTNEKLIAAARAWVNSFYQTGTCNEMTNVEVLREVEGSYDGGLAAFMKKEVELGLGDLLAVSAKQNWPVIKLKQGGLDRILESKVGMTFVVDCFTAAVNQPGKLVAHVRDYRYPQAGAPYQIWSISPDDYELLER